MRTPLISALVLGTSICIYACGGTTTSLLTTTGGAGGASMTGGNRGPGAFGDGITYGGGGSSIYYDCPGPFSDSPNCGGNTGNSYGGTTTTTVGSGGWIDSDMCSGRYPGAVANCGGAGGSLNAGGGGAGGIGMGGGGHAGAGGSVVPTDGGTSSGKVLNLSYTWATSADAGATLYNAIVMPDGTATCSVYRGGWLLIGREGQTDSTISTLLATPGTVDALATPCPLNVADVINSTIRTTFVGGAQVDRLVYGSCSTDNLAALVATLQRIGKLCVATGTMIRDY